MNENINLVEILKDCPKGTKLYTTVYGEVTFDKINNKRPDYPINVKPDIGYINLTKEGRYTSKTDADCILFPSKDQRDWSKFTAPWYKKEQVPSKTNERTWLYLVSDVLTWKDGIGQYLDDPRVQEIAKRLCDKYAQKLYNPSVISNSSNTGKDEKKFDPKTLQPFDKILVKGNKMDCVWKCSLHSHFDANYRHSFCANTGIYRMCIPYNDETKHLVGTTDEAPEYYRYWED